MVEPSDSLEPASSDSEPGTAEPEALSPERATVPRRPWHEALRRYELWIVGVLAAAILIPGICSYTLVDPWETHYGEVARRMIQDDDYVQLKWQNENFDSKPVLTFWLMAAGMKTMGVGTSDGYPGGYSGELTTSGTVMAAIRLPFVLFGIFGLLSTFFMLSRLVSRRVAWLSFLVLVTTPFYVLVARQGITDMPMVACLMGCVACIAMVVCRPQREPLTPLWRGVNAWHVFLALFLLVVGGQLVYFAIEFANHPTLAPGLRLPRAGPIGPQQLLLTIPFGLLLLVFVGACTLWEPLKVRTVQSVYMAALFGLIGVSILGKGPPAAAIIVAIAVFYVLLARRWDLVRSAALWIDIARGIVVMVLVALPWHLAIFFKQGMRWVNAYIGIHIIGRAFSGTHGDRGTFDYYAAQLGIGMWPWVALLPGALATVLVARLPQKEGMRAEDHMRMLVGTWAIVGFALFSAVQTKFHHYALPVVPALAILVALFLDDLLSGRVQRSTLFLMLASAVVLVVMRDLVGEQKQLIELFVYRYDRPWPSGEPWFVDVSTPLVGFGCCFAFLVALLAAQSLRRATLIVLAGAALCFSLWVMNGYMGAAAPHWGQRHLDRTYFATRTIHGIDTEYDSLRDLADEWKGTNTMSIRSVLPDDFEVGQPATITVRLPGAGVPDDRLVLSGKVSARGDDSFTVEIPASEHARLDPLIARGQDASPSPRGPIHRVDADRLIAWQLNWRGENFWTNGEIYGPWPETQTVYDKTDNTEFLEYLKTYGIAGRRYFVMTEAPRAKNLRPILPTENAKRTFQILDTSNNKFTLLSFTY